MTQYGEETVAKLFLLLDYEKIDIVEEKDFIAVMKPWSAFSSCDINNDNQLEVEEMEKLFWLYPAVEQKVAWSRSCQIAWETLRRSCLLSVW